MAEVGNLVAKVSMDQTGFQQGITALNRQLKVVQSEFKAATAGLGDFGKGTEGLKLRSDSLTKQLDIQRQRVQALEAAYKKSVETKGADAKATQNLEIRLNNAKAQMAGTEAELKKITAELEKQSSKWHQLSTKLQDAGQKMSDVGKSLTMRVTAPLMALGVRAAKGAIDIESAFAGVRKTVDATEEEFAQLRQGFIDMSKEIPIATTELMAVGEAAGQLGIEKENILGFSETMAKLGVTTNLSSEQAAMSLARLANITQMPQESFDRLGSTVVALGNSLATTEAEIVEMGLRLAGAGHMVGMTEAQILAFGGALSSVGIAAEAGGTAFSRVMLEINNEVMSTGENLQTFAAIAGMTVQEFAEQWKTDAAGALLAFVEGLGLAQAAGENVVPVLDELNLGEIRVRDALLRAAGAGDLFRESLETGSKAWEENNALNAEAEERFKTTASQLQLLGNHLKIVAATFGDVLLPPINGTIKVLTTLLDALSKLGEGTKTVTVFVLALAAAFPPLLWGTGKLLQALPLMASGAKALGSALLWLRTNPIGLVITGIGLLVAAGTAVYNNWDTVKNKGLQAWSSLKVGVLNAIAAIAAAYEKLYGWVPVLGDQIRSVHAKIRASLEEESLIIEERAEKAKRDRISQGFAEASARVKQATQDMQLNLDDTVPSFEGLGAAATGAGGKVGGAGSKMKEAAEKAKTAWIGTVDAVRSALGLMQSRHETAMIRAEMAGDNVDMLRLKHQQLNAEIAKQKEVVAATKTEVDKAIKAGVLEGETKEDLAKRIDGLNKKLADEERAQAQLEKQVHDTREAMKTQAQDAKKLAVELK
ncbi:MAG: phage tail tape measure protein, partial [Clostridium sp.]|nr:phage tail tape measure protein [Clostridium sp.]